MYKSLPAHDESFALLRKALRLDSLSPEVVHIDVSRSCGDCEVDVSPLWHDVAATQAMDVDGEDLKMATLQAGGTKQVCHQCYFKYR